MENDKPRLKLFYDDRFLARQMNRKERVDETLSPENMSKTELESILRIAVATGRVIDEIDVEWYKKALELTGAEEVEEISVSPHIYPPKFSIFYEGHFDLRKFYQLIYH
ncbi:glutaminyl-peptide cyclotransferase [Candidatus Woesearchaeota archaeon]|nr:glutaminyl-peptide cyclotransferase [Candidatus Woesearchaeota archaeon]